MPLELSLELSIQIGHYISERVSRHLDDTTLSSEIPEKWSIDLLADANWAAEVIAEAWRNTGEKSD